MASLQKSGAQGIHVSNLHKSIRKKPILKDINLELAPGSIYGFFGRNASGKTMLFRAIAGLILIDAGTVDVFGERVGRDVSFPSSMGLMIENVSLWGNLTGYENLDLLASIRQTITAEDIHNVMERVGLDSTDMRRYSAYSLGMKQKLALAQAIMEKPRLLVLDEPTNSLDDSSVKNFRRIITEEKARGAICLISTHQKEDIDELCDGLFEISNGCCKQMR